MNSVIEKMRRDMKKRESDCYEELAQVLVKYFPDMECDGRILRDRLNTLLAAEKRLHHGDCNRGCANYPTCVHNLGRHGIVRINCPLWRPKG
jgi:hypothetical protein